jgi:integrase
MPRLSTAIDRANAILRAHGTPFRLREGHGSRWLSIYENCPGRRVRERSARGYAARDDRDVERLCSRLLEHAQNRPDQGLDDLFTGIQPAPSGKRPTSTSPCWPEICQAVVAFQRGQGVNMNLVGPFKGQGYFRLLPQDRPATLEDVRRFALHTTESLKERLEDPSAVLLPMATHRQGFRQKREVVSLLRRAGFGAIAPQELSEELKGMVNRKKLALVAAGQSRRRIPSTAAIEEWLDQVIEEDPLWGWVFAMVATYGLRPHEVWHIDGLPDEHGLITIGVAARHIKVTKTGFRAAVPLPASWVERYQLGGANGEQRLAELRARHKPKFVNEDGQPFDPERDQVKRCDNNERLGAVCCHKLRSSDAKAEFELKTKLYAWVEVAAAEGRKKAQKRKERCVPYDLRHAYAIRARETTSWSYADVAAVMGHSPEVHRRTYLSEISGEQTKAAVVRRLLGDEQVA